MPKNNENATLRWSYILQNTRRRLRITRREMATRLGCKKRLIKVWESLPNDELTMERFVTYYTVMRPDYGIGPVRFTRDDEIAKRSCSDMTQTVIEIVRGFAALGEDESKKLSARLGVALSKLNDDEVIKLHRLFGSVMSIRYEAAIQRVHEKTAAKPDK